VAFKEEAFHKLLTVSFRCQTGFWADTAKLTGAGLDNRRVEMPTF
jgi:hypothetical protein